MLDLTHVDLFENGVKVYVVPRVLDKGRGVRRLRARFPTAQVFAAGDSLFDLPLLEAADMAFYPAGLPYSGRMGQQAIAVPEQAGIFSDVVLESLLCHVEGA